MCIPFETTTFFNGFVIGIHESAYCFEIRRLLVSFGIYISFVMRESVNDDE